jgi:predicted DNA-binding transcriptional regulator YafY
MNQHKLYRIFKMLELLQGKPRHIITLARYLEVTERTVYRYLDLFKKLGYEIQKHKFNKIQLIKCQG